MQFVTVILITLFLAGCGRKGPLIAPEALVPAPISDLRVAQQGERFLVSWSRPARDEGGRRLADLAGFRIMRRTVLPPGEDCEQCPDAYRLIKQVDLDYLRDATRFGDLFMFGDTTVSTGTAYQYKAMSVKRDGSASRDSNKVVKKKVPPPPPPRVKGRFTPLAAILQWEPVALPASTTLIGYNLYRRSAMEPIYPIRINEVPLTEPRFEDAGISHDGEYSYLVRTVARINGETAESEPSNEVTGSLLPPGTEE